ncbi:MAG: hypothetical protein LIR46_04430 [Bacteroidota bacterium]|nr:hypothetical protein [Bacteroidota bacterium]
MAKVYTSLYRNYDQSDSTVQGFWSGDALPSVDSLGWSAPSGYGFIEWNSISTGRGVSYAVGDPAPTVSLYAIWKEIPPPDDSVSNTGNTITKMTASGTKTLLTSGAYCTDDITIEYTKPAGGTVTISLTAPSHESEFESFIIYEATIKPTGLYSKGQQIGSITSPTGSTQVTVNYPANGIVCELNGTYPVLPYDVYDFLFHGLCGLYEEISETTVVFIVSGNGEIDIGRIDWDD